MTTTAAAIRTAMVDLVEALAPDEHSATPFRAHREGGDFRRWALQHPTACTRRFTVRFLGNVAAPPVSNMVAVEASDTVEVVIAYPNNERFGGDRATAIDDVIESDQAQVDDAIGPHGYRSLSAPATVLAEDGWTREGDDDDPVRFAVITYRVDWYRAVGTVNAAVQLVGASGQVYATGDVITTEATLRGLYLTNGLAKVTYTAPDPAGSETLSHQLHLPDGSGGWTRVMSAQYGDRSFFAITATVAFDRCTVVEASDDAVELAWQVDAYDLTSYSGGGIALRDEAGGLTYPINSSTAKLITSCVLVKTMRMQRGEAGYYVGWHASPLVGPPDSAIPSSNNDTSWGERSFGTGGGTAVAFGSGGVTSRHPAWGTARSEVSGGVYVAWSGIDDPTYSPWDGAAYIAEQEAGFPAEQSSGPFWVADLDADSAIPFCRYLVARERLQIGVTQAPSARGSLAVTFCNEMHSPEGIPYRHQLFIGADPYVADSSSSFANEPKAHLSTRIATLAAALDWPEH